MRCVSGVVGFYAGRNEGLSISLTCVSRFMHGIKMHIGLEMPARYDPHIPTGHAREYQ